MKGRQKRIGLGVVAAATLAMIGLASTAHAHGTPAELKFWGAFPPDTARCQRIIARATVTCAGKVAALRADCFTGAMRGETCDETALNARVTDARQRAVARVARACTETEIEGLGYIDNDDAFTDVVDACRQIDTATTSAAFGPAMVGGTVATVGDPTATCVEAAAREGTRMLRAGARAYAKALDRIAGTANLDEDGKLRLIQWAQRRIALTQVRSRAQLTAACGEDDFASEYGRSIDVFLDHIAEQAACLQAFVYVQDAVGCPTPSCGNGMQEPGEACDDGNDYEGDGCHPDCTETECDAFTHTADLIQAAIFEKHGCTVETCHGLFQSGGLDLRAGVSLANLVDVPSTVNPKLMRIEPGDPLTSLLFLKLASKTLPDEYDATELGIGSPMPSGAAPALSEDELLALRRFIYGAAPATGSVNDVAHLLDACTPEPEPIEIKPLEPLPPGQGVQLHMPQWIVDANSEHEVCFASYYDVTNQVPEELRGPNGDTFCYQTEQLRQDPLSHHLIVNLYIGAFGPDHPGWGTFKCRGGARDGESCVPTEVGSCGADSDCATDTTVRVGCSGFGPPDQGANAVPFAGAQQTNASKNFPEGVYRCVPLKGMILWNSHAFNHTNSPGKLEAWLNFQFAPLDQRQHSAQGIFNTTAIFNMRVPAFQQQEVCNIHVLPQNAKLFELTSHMHQRGKQWRTFTGAFTCQGQMGPRGAPIPCDPLSPVQCADGITCADPDGNDPMESLLYTNFVYNDPVELSFRPPLVFSGTPAQRSLTYCALYDNGLSDPTKVKRQSTSPITPFGSSTCPQPTHCYSGKVREACVGANKEERDRSCDTSDDAGDGLCDACTLAGGVTTEDEMFLLLGTFFQ